MDMAPDIACPSGRALLLAGFLAVAACGGGGGGGNAGGNGPPAPTASLVATPTAISAGGSSTLTWSSTDADQCAAGGGWTGSKGPAGSEVSGPLAATTAFQLTCSGAGGSAQAATTVTVTPVPPPAPTVTLTADPASIASGGASSLNWTTTDATGCTATGGWSGARDPAGSTVITGLAATTTYTLDCTGPGGTAGSTVTVTVTMAGGSPFPLQVVAGQRYLLTAQGQPFLMHGDSPWSLIVQLDRAAAEQYLEDRRLKGFNTLLVNLIEHRYADNPPNNAYGEPPFLAPGDFSSPNPAYFDHAAWVIDRARDKGMLILLAPAYLGFQGGDQGWYVAMGAAGTAALRDYGRYVATRLQAYDNILWVQGGDYNPPDRNRMRAVLEGIREIDSLGLHTFHGSRGTEALEWLGAAETWLDVNNIYTAVDTVVAEAEGAWQRSTMPYFLIEAGYEGESVDEIGVRQQAWQAMLSGAMGQLMGQKEVWPFVAGWQAALASPGASTLIHLRDLLASVAWWTLEPDFGNVLLTAGVDSGARRAVAARSGDGAFAILYVREVRDLTVDLGQLAGPGVTARWYDPTSGLYTPAPGSPFAANGSRVLRPPGNNARNRPDWALVLTSQ